MRVVGDEVVIVARTSAQASTVAPWWRPEATISGWRTHALLGAAGIEPPYVLLPHSIGGWAARVFTAAYPDEVAGIVFIDSSHPDQVARHRAILSPRPARRGSGIAFAREGNESLVTTPPGPEIGWFDLLTAADEARASGYLGDRPVIVLTADQELEELPEPYRFP